MPRFLLTWLLSAVALLITSYVVPGFYVANFSYAAVAAVILGLANAVVRPVLVLLTLPLTILSLGLFLLVVNAIVLSLVGFLMSNAGFRIDGFWPALFGSIVLSLVTGVLNRLVFKEQ